MAAEPLRVALLEPAGRGGICHYTLGLADALSRRPADASGRALELVLFTAKSYEFTWRELPFRVERRFDRWKTAPWTVLAALRRFRPHVLHLQSGTHPALHWLLAAAAKRLTGAPLLVTAHDVLPKNATRLDARFCARLYRAADAIVVHGAALAAEMFERFPFTGSKVCVVPHGEYGFLAAPAPRPASPATAQSAAAAARRTLLFFGYLHQEKGLPDLIEALPAVAREIDDLRVVIAGTAEMDLAPLVARTRELGLAARVEWRARYVRDLEMAQLFASATAVVLPYRKASQSGVAFLAGAFDRPLVATRVGALPELIEDGRTGVLVAPRDPAALARGLVRVLRDPLAARRLGQEHGRRCRQIGSWDAIAAKTIALYGVLRPAGAAVTATAPDPARRAELPRAPASSLELPSVTVLMPVRDEEAGIRRCLHSLLAQEYPRDRLEIVVMDGRSTDRTRECVREVIRRDGRVRLFDNPGRVVSTALNLGFGHARGAIVARADGHTRYAPDYLRSAARAFADSGADVVGGPMIAGWCEGAFERAAARALASRFGMGGAAFHSDGITGFAEGVYLGVFRRDALDRFGPFDEQLVRNQDDEWFARARARGARVFLDARIRSTYRPRSTPRALFRQYFEYGLFKPAALRRVRGSFRWRHAAPAALVLALTLPLLLGFPGPAILAALAYAVAALFASAAACGSDEGEVTVSMLLRVAGAFVTMHVGYGVGFLAGLARRVPDDTRAALRSAYARYAADPKLRRRWSERDGGQAQLVLERDRALARRLRARFGDGARSLQILDLGSGARDLAAALARQGVREARVVALDLLAERLEESDAAARVVADGRRLPFADASFDAVIQCTMLSSLRAQAGRRVVAAEMVRVCRPGGVVLSYDARLPNPLNRHVRRVSRREHAELFEGCGVAIEALTPLPPLARALPGLAARLAKVKALCAFDLAVASRPVNPEVPEQRVNQEQP